MIDLSTLYFAATLLVLSYLSSEYLAYRRRVAISARTGCKPPRALQQSPWLNGADIALEFRSLLKQRRFLEQTSLYFQNTAKTFTIQFFGATRIWTIEPENIKMVLQSDDFELGWIRLKAFHPWIGDAVQASNGAVWSHGRALLRPCFTRAQISNLELYEEHFQHFAALVPSDDGGAAFDVQSFFYRLAMDVSTEFLFGESVRSLQPVVPSQTRALEAAFETATRAVITRFNMGSLIYLHYDPRFIGANKLMHDYVQQFVNKALLLRAHLQQELERPRPESEEADATGGRYVFLHALARDTGDPHMLRDQLLAMMLAGRSSTASLLSLVFYNLVRHPEVLSRLRDEVSEHLGGNLPTFEQMRAMSYLKAIVDETLRHTPPAPQNERAAKRDTILSSGGGPDGHSPVYVRKGQTVFYHTYALHRSTELWGPDAGVWRPERWIEMKAEKGEMGATERGKGSVTAWRFVPFGGGGRICPGQQLSIAETFYFTIRILQTFSIIENRDEEPFREGLGVVFNSGTGVKISMQR